MNNQSQVYSENGLQYTLTENGAFIYRYEGDAERLVIPDALGGKPVIGLMARSLANVKATPNPYIREIDYKRINHLKLKEIVLPETLQSIGVEAFGGLGTLENLVIPDSVTAINGFAFCGCSALKHIRLPKRISGIDAYSFHNCLRLEEVIIPEGITYIGNNAFENCHSLRQIHLPDSVTSIGQDAFYESGLVSFTFPSGVGAIEHFMFSGCRDLEEVILPEQAKTIAIHVFERCASLKRIRIPASVENIGDPFVAGIPGSGKKSPNGCEKNVFNNCESLEAIDVDPDNRFLCSQDGVLYSKDKTVLILYPQGKKEEVLVVPEGVTALSSCAFLNNPYLREVHLPHSLKSIGVNAFTKCVNLRRAVPPSSLTSIGAEAYSFCTDLEEFPMPSSLNYIGVRAFMGCSRFEHLIFPDSLNVDNLSISSMENLKTVRIPGGVRYIGDISGCPKLEKIEIAEGHPRYVMEDGMLYEKGSGKNMTLCRLPESDKREVLRIPDNIRGIRKGAFEGCGFREVFFPDKMRWVPDAFQKCTNLEIIHFPASLREIDTLAFSGCTSLKKLVLPDGLETVGAYTFAGCTSLESIELPASLRNFSVSLFAGCTGLTDVYLRGGARTWCRRNVIRNRQSNFPDQVVFRYK